MELKIFGSNHFQSKESIIKEIEEFNPNIIGIELCKIREYIYLNNIKTKENEEDKSLLGKISSAIKKKAESENVIYGNDMFTALQYCLDNNISYVLVDKNIQETQNLLQFIPQKELEGFIKELSIFEKQTIAESTVNEDEFIKELKTNYPISYEILATVREQHIVINILKMIRNNQDKRILIIIGKGHLNSINKMLQC